ncbi:MAG: ParB/RepB/Spo0J family partition protein [Alphaproteobacteria bacterium]
MTVGDEGKKRQLGRGLSALLGEESEDYAELDRVRLSKTVPIEFLQSSRFQPRRMFNEEEILGLVESIRANGILQPILVRRLADQPDRFEIIAGERRWRAAQAAKLHEVPVIVKDLSDGDALEVALVENLQRQDLTPIEEAEAYRRLMEEFSHTQEDLARTLGKSRSHIANTMRLLALPDQIRAMLDEGKLTAGHGRALLAAGDPTALANLVLSRSLNVRQTEALVQGEKSKPRAPRRSATKDADTIALENEVSNLLGLKVAINYRPGGGTVVIHYQTLEQLDEVLRRLSHVVQTARPPRAGTAMPEPKPKLMKPVEPAGTEQRDSPAQPAATVTPLESTPAEPPSDTIDAPSPKEPPSGAGPRDPVAQLRVVGGTEGSSALHTETAAPSAPTSMQPQSSAPSAADPFGTTTKTPQ